jgi:hypothetical protein
VAFVVPFGISSLQGISRGEIVTKVFTSSRVAAATYWRHVHVHASNTTLNSYDDGHQLAQDYSGTRLICELRLTTSIAFWHYVSVVGYGSAFGLVTVLLACSVFFAV